MKKILSSLLATTSLLTLLVGCGNTPQLTSSAALASGRAPLQMQAANGMRSFNAQTSNTKLRIATYNIRNLFDGIANPAQDAALVASGEQAEKAKPEKELIALSESFHDINADIVALQEVESQPVLSQFRDKYLRDMGYKEVVLVEGNDQRGIDVALMSRYPISDVKSHKEVRFNVPGQGVQGFSRDLLQLRVNGPNNYKFTVFVAHLKSHHGDGPADIKRQAEAEKAREIIAAFQQANPGENVILMGDLNDPHTSQFLAPLVNPQVSGLGMHDVIAEELGVSESVFTYHPQKYRSRIDFIMMNENMIKEYQPKSVKLYKPYKQGDAWQKLYFYNASDHIPVTVDLDIAQDR